MYLVMFPRNEITCYWGFCWVFWRQFSVSSYWMILFWLFWDILGALKWGSSNVGHFAHLGGFAAGVGLGVLFCKKGWCLLDEYECSGVRDLVRQCGVLELKYAPKNWIGDWSKYSRV